jgi:methylmalonyl-CoA mutase
MDDSLHLQDDFPAPAWADWEALRDRQLKGRSAESVVWRTTDGFEVPPVIGPEEDQRRPPLDGPGRLLTGTRVIESVPREGDDCETALELGFDVLRVVPIGEDGWDLDYEQLLEGLPRGRIVLESDEPFGNQCQLAFATGSAEPLRVVPDLVEYDDGLSLWGRTPAQELAVVLAHGVWMLRGCPNPEAFAYQASPVTSQDPALLARCTALTVLLDGSVLTDIAKLRAIRRLWSQVTLAFGIEDARSRRAFVCAESSPDATSLCDVTTNLVRTSMMGFAAASGGADAVFVADHQSARPVFDDADGDRLALNQVRLLRDESFLDHVRDPAAGSRAIEALTDGIARRAWTLFQRIEAAGGFANAHWDGAIPALLELEEAEERRLAAARTRRRPFIGVSRFAAPPVHLSGDDDDEWDDGDLGDDEFQPAFARAGAREQLVGMFLDGDEDMDAYDGGEDDDGVMRERSAERFELLHLRANDDADARGERVRVLLVPIGSVGIRRARADFAQDFFRAGGFDVRDPHGVEGLDGAMAAVAEHTPAIVVLCGDDASYPTIAPALAAQLGDVPLYVAGKPSDCPDGWGAAGFVYEGIDAVAVLEAAHDRAGIGESGG